MRGGESRCGIILMAIAFLLAPILSSCGSGASTPPPLISVSFSGGTTQIIGEGQSVTITAIVSNDSSGKGVTWVLTCPGSLRK